ncbi:MAG: ISNCY family transposase [Gemmatimonas sp.]|nr:ISNCY family transposase [Gemmatimonas sp.]
MRQLFREQLALTGRPVDHPHARELEGIDLILRDNPAITELVLQDLQRDLRSPENGRDGLTAEQVLRAAVLKQLNTFSYDELTFHLADSATYRTFCGIGAMGDEPPSKATLQRNIKRITEESWEQVNRILMGYAAECGVEDGRKVRIDATVVESSIHSPTDSSLLCDAVRVLTRLLRYGNEKLGLPRFPNRSRRAKRRALGVLNAKTKRQRLPLYRDLLKVTKETVEYARSAADELKEHASLVGAAAFEAELRHFIELTEQIIDQTERRVLKGESVPATEKLVSIFEEHTDIIKKDNREIHYGHKLTLTGGRSGLITDWVLEDGNPADSTLALRMLERQEEIYGRLPKQAAFDGGYASKENLSEAKERGVQDVSFSKKCGLEVLDMVKSHWVYKRLRNFRAGIEAWISFLKRSFGLDRCSWKGAAGFARYVGASIVAGNLLTLARHRLA